MGKGAILCLLGGALTLAPIFTQGEGSASRAADSSKAQRAFEFAAAGTVPRGQGAHAQVPEKYVGTWVLDPEATGNEIADQAPAKANERWHREAGDLVRWEWEISADRVISSLTTKYNEGEPHRDEFRVELKQEGPELTILSVVGPGGSRKGPRAVHLRLVDDGSLRIRTRTATGWGDDDYVTRFFVYRKETGEARATAGRGTNRAVAYLDALKACAPGEFQFSYSGLGEFRNTVVGKEGERCRVTIVHSNMHMVCSFSDETVALLTSAQKYEETRKGVLAGSTDSEESARVNKECRIE